MSWRRRSPTQRPSRSTTGRTAICEGRFSISCSAACASMSGATTTGALVITPAAVNAERSASPPFCRVRHTSPSVTIPASRLAGIVTDGDVRRTLQKGGLADLSALTAAGVMTSAPVVVAPDMLAHAALQLMENRPSQIAVLPVVERDGRCVGLLRLHDIVRSGL